jgi:hypothetical protein
VLRCVIIGMVIGAVAELGARSLQLWVYRRPRYPIVNVVVVFGIVMGSIAGLVPRLGLARAFVIACAVGLVWEIVNLTRLLWGFVPLLITAVQAVGF